MNGASIDDDHTHPGLFAFKKLFADMGLSPVGSSPEYLVDQIRTETAKLSAVAASIPGGIN